MITITLVAIYAAWSIGMGIIAALAAVDHGGWLVRSAIAVLATALWPLVALPIAVIGLIGEARRA